MDSTLNYKEFGRDLKFPNLQKSLFLFREVNYFQSHVRDLLSKQS